MKRIGFIDGRRIAGWHFPATATPGNGQVVDVTDPSLGAVGNVYASILRYRPTGDKTAQTYSVARRIEVFPQGDAYLLHGLSIYFDNPIGTPTIHQYFAQDIFMQPLGTAIGVFEMAGISIGMNYTVPTVGTVSTFLRLYTHGAVAMPSAIRIGGSGMDNLIQFQRSVAPFLNGAVGIGQTAKIQVHCADTGMDWFIPLYQT